MSTKSEERGWISRELSRKEEERRGWRRTDLPVLDEDRRHVEVGESVKLELGSESGLDVSDLLLLLPGGARRLLPVGEVRGVDALYDVSQGMRTRQRTTNERAEEKAQEIDEPFGRRGR
jgi:hypothetical protein